MRNQRQTRASSMHSTSSTQSYQMNSSKAMINQFPQQRMQQSGLKQSTLQQQKLQQSNMLKQSNIRQSAQFPKIMNMQDGKTADDQYVSKLHNHISFLNENVNKLKSQQTDYSSQIMNMMHPQNDKQVVDHAITTQNKFKDMKQHLIQQIHALQQNNVQIISELLALQKQKEYLDKKLEEEQLTMELKLRDDRESLEQSKQKQVASKERRDEKEFLIMDLEQQLKKLQQEYKELKEKVQEKNILEQFDLEIEEKKDQIEDETIAQKQIYLKELEEIIDKCNQDQSNDKHYNDSVRKNQQLKEEYEELLAQMAIIQYELDEKTENVRYAQRRKDESVIEYQNDKIELQKYIEVKEKINERNVKRIEDYLQRHKGPELVQKQRELQQITKKTKEYQQNHQRLEKQLRQETIFITKKQNQLNDLNYENEEMQKELDQIQAQLNSNQSKYDSRAPEIEEQYEKFEILKDEKIKLEEENIKNEEKKAYLECLMEKLQERVNLEEEMRKVQVEQLKNITYDNQQLNQNINNFYNNWGTMSQAGRSQLYQQ